MRNKNFENEPFQYSKKIHTITEYFSSKLCCLAFLFICISCQYALSAILETVPSDDGQKVVTAAGSLSVTQNNSLLKKGTATLLITQSHDTASAYGTIDGAIIIEKGSITIAHPNALGSGTHASPNNTITLHERTTLGVDQSHVTTYTLPQQLILNGNATLDTGTSNLGGIITSSGITYAGKILTVIGKGTLTPNNAMVNGDTGVLALKDAVVLRLTDTNNSPQQINLSGSAQIKVTQSMTLNSTIHLG
jgi:hypothetical protein